MTTLSAVDYLLMDNAQPRGLLFSARHTLTRVPTGATTSTPPHPNRRNAASATTHARTLTHKPHTHTKRTHKEELSKEEEREDEEEKANEKETDETVISPSHFDESLGRFTAKEKAFMWGVQYPWHQLNYDIDKNVYESHPSPTDKTDVPKKPARAMRSTQSSIVSSPSKSFNSLPSSAFVFSESVRALESKEKEKEPEPFSIEKDIVPLENIITPFDEEKHKARQDKEALVQERAVVNSKKWTKSELAPEEAWDKSEGYRAANAGRKARFFKSAKDIGSDFWDAENWREEFINDYSWLSGSKNQFAQSLVSKWAKTFGW